MIVIVPGHDTDQRLITDNISDALLCSGLLKLFGYKLTRGGHFQLKYNNLFSPFVFKTKRFSPVIVSSLLILIISSQSVISSLLEVIGTAFGTSRFILSPLITVSLKSLAQTWLSTFPNSSLFDF
jgi:hypothetical protein